MLTSLAYVLLLGMALGTMASRLRLPSLVGMLLAGILLGPCVLNLLSPSLLGISADLRQLALVIILTRAGLSLELEDLRRAGRPAVQQYTAKVLCLQGFWGQPDKFLTAF